MSDKPTNFAEMLIARRHQAEAPPSPAPPADTREAGDNQAAVNASRRQQRLRLNFVFKDGRELSLAYAYLVAVSLDGSTMALEFTGCTVTLNGRNLRKLKRKLDLHVLGTVREVDELVDKVAVVPTASAVYGIAKEDH